MLSCELSGRQHGGAVTELAEGDQGSLMGRVGL
jgi:hypothetical protein